MTFVNTFASFGAVGCVLAGAKKGKKLNFFAVGARALERVLQVEKTP